MIQQCKLKINISQNRNDISENMTKFHKLFKMYKEERSLFKKQNIPANTAFYISENMTLINKKQHFFLFFLLAFVFIDRTAEDMTGNRSGGRHAVKKVPLPRLKPRAPVHGTPAPPAKPNSAPQTQQFWKQNSQKRNISQNILQNNISQ